MFRRLLETLAIAAVGGVTLGRLGLPAGYLSGAILLTAAAALAGRPLMMPQLLTRAIFLVIGTSLGAVVTRQTLHGMAHYPLSIAVLIFAMVCISLGASAYLYLVHRWRLLSAYLAASPGGMSQVLVVAAELDADLRGIAIVQRVRVVIIAVGLPAGLALLGFAGHAVRPGNGPFSLALAEQMTILVAASIVAGWIAFRFRFPGGLLFGAMFASAALHRTGLIHAVAPPWVANLAMVMLGGVIGARFASTSLRVLGDYIAAAFGSFAVAVGIATLFGAGVIHMMGLPVPAVMIAYALGSVDANDALGAGAAPRSGLYRRASRHAHHLRVVGYAAVGALARTGPGRRTQDAATTSDLSGLIAGARCRSWTRHGRTRPSHSRFNDCGDAKTQMPGTRPA